MADKLLVAFSLHGATAAYWRGNRIVECRTFADDDAGRAGFRDHLTQFSDVPVHIMVDAVEEDYRFETLPHAFGSDRTELVNRKLKQHYRNTPYQAASLLGRETGKRRDDRYLFSALTNPELIEDWLQEVAASGLPIAGIHLLPMVSAALPDKLDTKAQNLLLVAQHPTGLRLTFFHDRQFRLSRLTRADTGREENRVRYFAEEISNTRLYLHALRTMTLDEQLAVVMIDRNDELAEVVEGVARENPGLAFVRLGRRELAARLGIAEALLDSSPYVIYLQLLGLKTPSGNLAPASLTVGHQRYQARRSVYAGCGVLAATAVVWAGVNFYQAMTLRGDAEDAARRTAQISAEYLEVTRQFPQAPASAENLQKAVEIAQKVRESVRTPQRVMALVSRALEASPAVVIREFGWKYGATEIEAESAARGATAAQPAPQPSPAAPAQASQRKESALIDGEIRPFRGDYRGAIAAINSFAKRLSEGPEIAEVRVVKLPLNVDPALSLSGSTLDNPGQATGSANFKVLLVLKPEA